MYTVFISGTDGGGLKEIKHSLVDYIRRCGHEALASGVGKFQQNLPDVMDNCVAEARRCTHFILLLSETSGSLYPRAENRTITEAEFYAAYQRRGLCQILVFVREATHHEFGLLKRLRERSPANGIEALYEVLHADQRIYRFLEELDKLSRKPCRLPFRSQEDIKRCLSHSWNLPPEDEVLYDGAEIYTENVYRAYGEARGKTIYSHIATWPILPEKLRENQTYEIANWTIMGPITKDNLGGVLWRMMINKVRVHNGLSPLVLLHRTISGTKFIVAGDNTVLMPIAKDPEERTKKHIIRRSEDEVLMFRDRFFYLAQDSVSAEERICEIVRDDVMADVDHMPLCDLLRRLFVHWEKLGIRNVDHLDRGRCREVLWECLDRHGSQIGVGVEGDCADEMCICRKWRPRRLASDHKRIRQEYNRTGRQRLPSFRVVVTNRCNLSCEYCPPNNENYPSMASDIDINSLDLTLNAVVDMGFEKISFTGGEPLLHGGFLPFFREFAARYPDLSLFLGTNGVCLTREVFEQLTGLKNITLKVSLDTLDRVMYKKVCGHDCLEQVKEAVQSAAKLGIRVGINFVLRKENRQQLGELIKFAKEQNVYLKILDLNWYADMGRRKSTIASIGDQYWEHHYWPLDEAKEHVAKNVGPLRMVAPWGGYGVPMWETPSTSGGFLVRVRDWRDGAYYSDGYVCRLCKYCRTRKCHEGLYQLTLTSEFALKVCRHRPDLAVSLSRTIQECRDARCTGPIKRQIGEVLSSYFFNARLL